MKNCHFYISLIVLIFFTKCTKPLDYEISSMDQKGVISCFLKAGHNVNMFIGESRDIFDTTPTFISDIKITGSFVENGITMVDLEFDMGIFTFDYQLRQGNQYQIVINNGDNELKAETTIPEQVNIIEAYYYYGRKKDEYSEYLYECNIEFSDPIETENFYELFYYGSFYDLYEISEPVIIAENILTYEPETFVFSDNVFNGKNYTIQLNVRSYKTSKTIYWSPKPYIKIKLRSISKEYYTFMKSWYRHYYNQNIVRSQTRGIVDPTEMVFKGEPVELYSNIEGGLGIFAGYSEDSCVLEYRKTP